jgi:prolipoprotein diacylglyceryltransferase
LQAPGKHTARWIDQGLWLLGGALAGGRLAHVMAAWPYYSQRPLDIPQIWLGGISAPGALGGGLLALVIIAVFTRQNLGALADGYLPLMSSLVVSAWLACWADGAAYGAETSAWWGLPARDEWGEISRRVPLQMLAALLALAVFWYADRRRDPKRPGQGASLGLSGLGLLLFVSTFWRADPSTTLAGLRPEAWVGLGIALLAALAYLLARLPLRRVRQSEPVGETDILNNPS